MNAGVALRRALTGRDTPLPTSAAELVDYGGGRPAIARVIAGIPDTGALPRKGTDERRRYEAALRRVQRWTTTGAERRRPAPETLSRTREQLVRRRTNIPRLLRRGARARVRGWVVVPSPGKGREDRRLRELPSGGPGLYLEPAAVRTFVRPFLAGDDDTAGAAFVTAFLTAYGGPDDDTIADFEWIRIWPDGSPER